MMDFLQALSLEFGRGFLAHLRYHASAKSGALDPWLLPMSIIPPLDLCGLDMYSSLCV